MKKHFLFIIIFLLSACATQEIQTHTKIKGIYNYIENFPTLEQTIIFLSEEEIFNKCSPHKPLGKTSQEAIACSSINLNNKTCTIFLPKNYEQWTLEHEKAHCLGGDHDNILHNYYEKWKKLNEIKS